MNKTVIEPNLVVINSYSMDNNTYIIFNQKEAVVIDPSFNGDDVIKQIHSDVKVVAVLLTHAHFDHSFETSKLLEKYDCNVYMLSSEKETYKLYDCSDWFEREVPDFSSKLKFISAGKQKIGDFDLEILHTPGHTSGGMTIIFKNYVFVGDTLFFDSYGRTDLYNSSQQQMKQSIKLLFKTINFFSISLYLFLRRLIPSLK